MLPLYAIGVEEVEENERQQVMREENVQRRRMRAQSDPFAFTDIHFKQLYRLSKAKVQYLIDVLSPHMSHSLHPSALEPQLRIFATLYFLANGSYQRVVGHDYALHMAQTTVSKCINEVVGLIVEHLSEEWIKFPTEQQDIIAVKAGFMDKFHFPGVIGALDCTHVALIAPKEEEHNYLNRKGIHSKNVQLICDSNLKILNVNPQYAGATHDSYIWRYSSIRQHLEDCHNNGDTNTWLLGDSGYPQEPWLMTPILNAAPGSPEERYTTRHVSARNIIERCIGVLKGRFRCIMGERKLRYEPEKVGFIVVACCILHNICLTDGNNDYEELFVQDENNNDDVGVQIQANVPGRNARDILIQRYFSE